MGIWKPAFLRLFGLLYRTRLIELLYRKWRINRRPSNQLMMGWLADSLIHFRNLPVAMDVGCGKAINRPWFSNPTYVGVDVNPTFLCKAADKYPADRFLQANLAEEDLPTADLVVCTLVLHNKHYPPERTVDGVRRLIAAVNPGGALLFTTAQVNVPYEDEVTALLTAAFTSAEKRLYGNWNQPSYLSIPLAWLMRRFPPLRTHPRNRMIFHVCAGRFAAREPRSTALR